MNNNGLLQILIVIAITLAILYGINYLTSQPTIFNQGEVSASPDTGKLEADESPVTSENMTTGYRQSSRQPGAYPGTEMGNNTASGLETSQSGCPNNTLTPDDLLPKDESSAWAQQHPAGSGSLAGKNWLQAGQHVGIDTVGQTLRNANLQIRSEPPNPRLMVSPWLNSTIEADTNRRPFELGEC
jgi:hypothetical protein